MSGSIGTQVRSAAGKVWFDRFDVDGFARFFRARFPTKTAAYVADETGLPIDSVKKWLSGEAVPGGKALMALLCVYGPDLAHEVLHGAPDWLSTASRVQKAARIEAAIKHQSAELQRLIQDENA